MNSGKLHDFPKIRGGEGQRQYATFLKIHPFWYCPLFCNTHSTTSYYWIMMVGICQGLLGSDNDPIFRCNSISKQHHWISECFMISRSLTAIVCHSFRGYPTIPQDLNLLRVLHQAQPCTKVQQPQTQDDIKNPFHKHKSHPVATQVPRRCLRHFCHNDIRPSDFVCSLIRN